MFTGRDVVLFIAVLVFFVGFNMINVGKGVMNGEIQTKGDLLKAMNPIKSLDTYERWFAESYEQTLGSSVLQIRNAYFGMFVSSFAIMIFFGFLASLIYIPMPNEPKFALLAIGLAFIPFTLVGGFEGVLPVFKSLVLGKPWHMPYFPSQMSQSLNQTSSEVLNTTTTQIVDLRG